MGLSRRHSPWPVLGQRQKIGQREYTCAHGSISARLLLLVTPKDDISTSSVYLKAPVSSHTSKANILVHNDAIYQFRGGVFHWIPTRDYRLKCRGHGLRLLRQNPTSTWKLQGHEGRARNGGQWYSIYEICVGTWSPPQHCTQERFNDE